MTFRQWLVLSDALSWGSTATWESDSAWAAVSSTCLLILPVEGDRRSALQLSFPLEDFRWYIPSSGSEVLPAFMWVPSGTSASSHHLNACVYTEHISCSIMLPLKMKCGYLFHLDNTKFPFSSCLASRRPVTPVTVQNMPVARQHIWTHPLLLYWVSLTWLHLVLVTALLCEHAVCWIICYVVL